MAAKRFMRTLKVKIDKSWHHGNIRSYLDYLDKLVSQYNSTYHRSIGKIPIDADCCTWAGKVETNPKAPKLKVGDRVRIKKYKNVFKKG